MKTFLTFLALTVIALATAIVLIFLFTFPVMYLWNMLAVPLFSAPMLSFWQTFGLLVLLRLILPTQPKVEKPLNSDTK
jgi:hypothetical protein